MRHHVSVIDSFEIKTSYVGSNHAPGVVIIFDGRQCGFDLPQHGASVELLRPDGSSIQSHWTETKNHGDGRSLFFPDLKLVDVPIGTVASWEGSALAERGSTRELATR